MEAIEAPVWADKVRAAIREAQIMELTEIYDSAMFNQLGMRLDQWVTAWPSNQRIFRAGRAVMRNTPLEVELTVGGFIGGGPLLLEVLGKDPINVCHAFSVIGSGFEAAQAHLHARKQSAYTSVVSTVAHLSEALDLARSHEPDTVGEQTDYVVLTPKQSRRLPYKYAKELATRCAGKDTALLDLDSHPDWQREVDSLMAALYFPGVTKQGYEQGKRAPGN
jgi:hypothetical protein